MTEIKIPFLPEFEDDMKYGQKVMTTRSKKYGKPGDTFNIFDTDFTILSVFKLELWQVKAFFYAAEGFFDSKEFIKIWNKIHYRLGYDKQKYDWFWCHIFIQTQLIKESERYGGKVPIFQLSETEKSEAEK